MGLYHVGKSGRVYIRDLNGTCGRKGFFVPEHRYLMAKAIGRPLKDDEFVRHIDGNLMNNEQSNLELVSRAELGHIYGPNNYQKPKKELKLTETIMLTSVITRMREMGDYSAPKDWSV